MKSKYIGHPSQACGVFEMRMEHGKADGMRILDVRNGKGLEIMISPDRCADLNARTVHTKSCSETGLFLLNQTLMSK